LRRLAKSILRRCAPEEIVAENPDWQVVDAWDHGDLYVLEQLWRRLGIPEWFVEPASVTCEADSDRRNAKRGRRRSWLRVDTASRS
jgi:hypothetical protein